MAPPGKCAFKALCAPSVEVAKPYRPRIAILVNQQSFLSSQNMGGMEEEIHVQEEEKAEEEGIEKALLASKAMFG